MRVHLRAGVAGCGCHDGHVGAPSRVACTVRGPLNRFIEENKLDGGHLISAQSGESVVTAFYEVAAEMAGVQLSAAEREHTKRILGVTVVAGEDDDEQLSEAARKIMEEDAALEAARDKREAKKGCCVVQ